MAAFDEDATFTHPLDFELAGGPTLFWRAEVLEVAISWLGDNGYDVVSLVAAEWGEPAQMHRDLAHALSFPAYYGNNLDALNDCMFGVACGEYGIGAEAAGLALVLRNFDGFVRDDRATAHLALEIFAGQAAFAMRFGRRILILLQSDDPNLVLDPVGAITPRWNGREWLDTSREL